MTPEEQLESVKELEERVERLRALYEQYFLGFEKIEPGVQRKDVDRRLAVLRREQIRNTGLRFKFNQITARYNTYATHWQRVVREIENGTYKRDVIRAAKRFGAEALTTAAKKRFKHLKTDEQTPAPNERSDIDLDVDFHDDDDDGFLAPMAPAAARALSPPPPPSARASGPVSESRPSAPPSSRNPSSDPAPGSLRPLAPARPASIPAGEYASTPRPVPTVPVPPPARAPAAAASLDDDDDDELFAGLDLEHAAKIPVLGQRAPSLSPAARTQPIAAAPPARPAARTLDVTRSLETPRITTQPEPLAASAPAPRPAPVAAARPAPVAAARPAPVAAAPLAARAPAPAAQTAAAPANSASLSDGRLREIYGQFVETKRKCQESTAAVTFDGLARNLRESAAKLAEKHAGKKIDFEVVVKDGKTVLKPVVR